MKVKVIENRYRISYYDQFVGQTSETCLIDGKYKTILANKTGGLQTIYWNEAEIEITSNTGDINKQRFIQSGKTIGEILIEMQDTIEMLFAITEDSMEKSTLAEMLCNIEKFARCSGWWEEGDDYSYGGIKETK